MKKLFLFLLIVITLIFFTGCAPFLEKLGKLGSNSQEISLNKAAFPPSYYLRKAKEYEINDELQRALFYMKIAIELDPSDRKIAGKISDLESTIDHKADKHFKKGITFYKKSSFKAARKQFLTALRYKPDHKGALDYLENRLTPKKYISYSVKRNDSLKSISEKFYKDPEKVFLIVYFNDLKPDTEPLPGTMLKLPILALKFIQPTINIRKELLKAKNFIKENQFKEVVGITERILKYDPSNRTAIDLKNSAYYHIGIGLSRKEKYAEAIKIFKKITPEYEDAKEAIQDITQKKLLKAENFLKEKKYDAAIDMAENIMRYDKSNTAAEGLMNTAICQKGKSLLIRKKYTKALKVLQGANPAYACVDKTISSIKKAMKKQAEIYYLQGVKHFLNEDLKRAIKEWEMTLTLNPEHKKAKKDIKNARNILDRLNRVHP